MRFSLSTYPSPTPIPSLRGGSVRYRPMLPLVVIGPTGQEAQTVLVDTGSDDIAFPEALAHRIGIDLSTAPCRLSQGVGGAQPVSIAYASVILVLTDARQTVRWRATVGFTSASLRFPLFGIAGGLEFFQTTLDMARGEIELLPLPSLPATQDRVP